MDALPPFTVGDEVTGAYFALATVCGHYAKGRTPDERACLVLYCSFGDRASFSWMSFASDGVRLSYHRGHDIITTPEFAALSAYLHEGIPPQSWVLYPRGAVDDAAFPDATVRHAYWNARRGVCEVLRQSRIGRGVVPLFIVDEHPPTFHDAAAEHEEIGRAMEELIAGS
jgi:hypothetical protein